MPRVQFLGATSDGTATLFSAAQTFDNHGRVDRITLEGGAYWDYGYDSMGQVTSGVKKGSGGTALPGYTFGYGFDTIGNRETATRQTTTETYTPNLLNQITSIDQGGLLHLLGTADASATVLVDGAATTRSSDLFYGTVSGNNTFESFSILGTLTGAGDGGSDAVARFDREAYIPAGATSRTHDESGNLTEDAEWTYTWDAENRLIQMETRPSVVSTGAPHRRLTFNYDSQSRRTRKTVETWDGAAWQTDEDIRFLWNDWLLSAELEADTLEPIRSYTWGLDLAGTREQTGGVGGLALVKHHKNGEVSVPLFTTNGNVRGYWEIDAADLVAEFEYGPFGELLRATGEKSGTHAFRFSTKYEDTETGLVYYGYRFFDPETGRWLNRDPIEEAGGIGIYIFIENAPTTETDYLGLIRVTAIPGIMRANGWSQGADLMDHWFAGSGSPNTTIVSMQWVLGFSRAKDVYDEILDDELYANRDARKEIVKLIKASAPGSGVHSFGGVTGNVVTLDSDYIQFRSVGSYRDPVDGLFAALGRFTFRVLVQGSATIESSGDVTCVGIRKVGIYVRDQYDFVGNQSLGYWNARTN